MQDLISPVEEDDEWSEDEFEGYVMTQTMKREMGMDT